MPQPSLAQVHAVDVPLSNLSQAIIQDEEIYGVSRRVFPIVNVPQQSNRYYVWNQSDFFRTDAQKRASGSESAGSGLNLSLDSYYCDVWASHFDIGYQERANADAGVDLDRAAVAKVTRDILIREDLDWASTFFVTGVWNASTAPAVPWENVNSTPIEDVRGRFYTMASNTGLLANKLILGANAFKRLQDHPDILDRIKYTQKAVVTQDLIASVLSLGSVEVLFGVRDTSADGAATGTFGFIAGNHALLVHAAPAPGLMAASAGYTFQWTGLQGAAYPIAVSRFPIEFRKVERIEAETAFDNKLVSSLLGEMLLNAVTS